MRTSLLTPLTSLQELNAAEKDEDYNTREHETYATGRKIIPVTAVRPTRNSAYQCHDQNRDQDRSKPSFFLLGNPASESLRRGP
jgi:hypothetical protein